MTPNPFRSLAGTALLVLGALAPAASTLLTPAAQAATFTVTKAADTLDGACDADCSLREAIQAANALPGEDTVQVGPGVYKLTRTGAFEEDNATGDLNVKDRLILVGAGAASTILDGNGTDRVLTGGVSDVSSGLVIRGVTIRNGYAAKKTTPPIPHSGYGGGIVGNVTVEDSVITGNQTDGDGGGIRGDVVTIRNSTISDNLAKQNGGGIHGWYLELDNVTISGNRALGEGGGLRLFPALDGQRFDHVTVTANEAALAGGIYLSDIACTELEPCPTSISINRSIVAGNVSGGSQPDCYSVSAEGSGNVFGVKDSCSFSAGNLGGTLAQPLDPKLGPLADNGGPTPTHLPIAGSPAIDSAGDCSGTDQRGAVRPADGDSDGLSECDAGAVELSEAACFSDAETLCLQGGRFRVTANWETPQAEGTAKSIPLTAETGAFWFFNAENIELMIKVLDGCGINDRFWVFMAGLTDVGVEILVDDTFTGLSWHYGRTGGAPFPTVTDTNAFPTCDVPDL